MYLEVELSTPCDLYTFGCLILDILDLDFAQTSCHWKACKSIFFLSLLSSQLTTLYSQLQVQEMGTLNSF